MLDIVNEANHDGLRIIVQAAQFRLSGSPIRAGSGPGCAPSPAPPARTCTCNRRCRRSAAAAAARSRHGRRPRLNTHHSSVSLQGSVQKIDVCVGVLTNQENLRTSSAELLLQAPTFRSNGIEPAVGKLSWIRGSTAEASVVDQPPPDRPSITNFSLRSSHEFVFIREVSEARRLRSLKKN